MFRICWQGTICNEKLHQPCEIPLALSVPGNGCNSFSWAQHSYLQGSVWSGSWLAKRSLLQMGVQGIPSAPAGTQCCQSPKPELLFLSVLLPGWHTQGGRQHICHRGAQRLQNPDWAWTCQRSNMAGKLWHFHWETIEDLEGNTFKLNIPQPRQYAVSGLDQALVSLCQLQAERWVSPQKLLWLKVTWVSRDWIQTFS